MTASRPRPHRESKVRERPAADSWRRWISVAPIAMSALVAAGCGGAEATLSGRVLVDGEPIAIEQDMRGKIVFQATAGKAAPAFGTIDEAGNYEAMTGSERGLAPGNYAITVDVVKTIPSNTPDQPPWAKRLTPPRYVSSRSSGLSVTVEPGSNEHDIEITTKAG